MQKSRNNVQKHLNAYRILFGSFWILNANHLE